MAHGRRSMAHGRLGMARSGRSMAHGQASVEAMALLAGGLLVLIAVFVVFPEQATRISASSGVTTAIASANRLADEAGRVYLAGDGAQASVWMELPETYDYSKSFIGSNDAGADWPQKKTVGINIVGYGDVFAESSAPMCGTLPNASGRYLLPIVYNTSGHVMINKESC